MRCLYHTWWGNGSSWHYLRGRVNIQDIFQSMHAANIQNITKGTACTSNRMFLISSPLGKRPSKVLPSTYHEDDLPFVVCSWKHPIFYQNAQGSLACRMWHFRPYSRPKWSSRVIHTQLVYVFFFLKSSQWKWAAEHLHLHKRILKQCLWVLNQPYLSCSAKPWNFVKKLFCSKFFGICSTCKRTILADSVL